MPKFRKKSIEVDARQFVIGELEKIAIWCNGNLILDGGKIVGCLFHTRIGRVRADYGDWILKNEKNEFASCKPDIFSQTYEPVIEG